MKPFAVIDAQTWQLSGELNFSTATDVLTAFQQATGHQTPPKFIDLKPVTRTDSAGLALLLELRRLCDGLCFLHMPAQMHSIARISGVEDILLKAE